MHCSTLMSFWHPGQQTFEIEIKQEDYLALLVLSCKEKGWSARLLLNKQVYFVSANKCKGFYLIAF